jgi:lysophospholipase L1-like esterase
MPLLISLLCALAVGGAAHADSIDPSNASILYTGRWNQANPSAPWAQQKGSSVIVNFEGTSVAVTLTTDGSEEYRAIIDGDALASMKGTLNSGASNTLASGLVDTVHTLELIKETDFDRATLTAIDTDSNRTLVAPPARPTQRIVFYGDSNVAGHSLESERDQSPNPLKGSYYTYAGIVARMFDAEHHNVSRSGATIGSLNSRFDRYDWDSNNPDWNFSLFQPHVVIVNIGANDIFSANKSTIKNRYHDLIDDLRVKYPAPLPIVLFNATGWDFNEPANYTHEVVSERIPPDPNLSVATFPWLFEQFHGCETDHAGMAVTLAEHIEGITGWLPGTSDVVSGYGADGDVANGSFEQVAPFGGWGWRYFDDADVARVFDPSGVDDGDYYLQLDDGATAQQTNPAEDGEDYEFHFRARGTNNGDEVDVTIGFRDQDDGADAGGSPNISTTETMILTDTWQEYTTSATAPASPANPTYSVRITFEAAAGDTIDIDRVELPEPSSTLSIVAGAALLAALKRRRSLRRATWARPHGNARRAPARIRPLRDPRCARAHPF